MPKKKYQGMSTFSSRSLAAATKRYSTDSSFKGVEDRLNQNTNVAPPSGKVSPGKLPSPTTPSSTDRPVGSVPKTPAGTPAPTVNNTRPASGPTANPSTQQSMGRGNSGKSFNHAVNRGGGSGGGGGVGNSNNRPDPNETPAERANKRKQYKGQNRDMFLSKFSNSSSSNKADSIASLLELLGEGDDKKNKRNKFRKNLISNDKQNTLLGKYVGGE